MTIRLVYLVLGFMLATNYVLYNAFNAHKTAYLLATGYLSGCVHTRIEDNGASNGVSYAVCSYRASGIYIKLLIGDKIEFKQEL